MSFTPAWTLCVPILFLVVSTTDFADADWPQFGGENRNFQYVANEDHSTCKVGVWSIDLSSGDAAPIVYRDRIYVNESAWTDDGEEAVRVRCVEPTTGKTVWAELIDEKSYLSQDISDAYPVRPLASLTGIGGRILSISYGGCVACLDATSGRVVWSHDLVHELNATPLQFGWASSPWVGDDLVVIACGGEQGMLVAFQLESGELIWRSEPGEAAFGSIVEVKGNFRERHLVYQGRDTLIGVDARNGTTLWRYPLTKKGLTNAVTPLALDDGKLLVAGQGFGESQLLQILQSPNGYEVNTIWRSNQLNPFYCNWLTDAENSMVFSYGSNRVGCLDLADGSPKWKIRGWTDANFAIVDSRVVGVRGDGFVGVSSITQQGLRIVSGARVINDRVWTPPVVVRNMALIRGRRTLSTVNLSDLPAIAEVPSGTQIDSMTAMYGQRHEATEKLLEKAKRNPSDFRWEDYQRVMDDKSIRFGEREYRELFEALKSNDQNELLVQLAEDWVRREPESIVAFDKWVSLCREDCSESKVDAMLGRRFVNVDFEVVVPDSTPNSSTVYAAGNANSIGGWKPDGLLLKQDAKGVYRGQARLPTGSFEYKMSLGSWDLVEVRVDGRSISNRRRHLTNDCTVKAVVQQWNKPKAKAVNAE